MMIKLMLASIFCILSANIASAVDNPDAKLSTLADKDIAKVTTELETCMNENLSSYGMRLCMSTAADAADKILNRVYSQKLVELKKQNDKDSKEVKSRLVTSEKAWVSYRDTQCIYEGANELGGSDEGLVVSSCVFKVTEDRIVSLRNNP